jgi:protein-S-isoprenylcysteine O-methyltransferase Ste14
MLFRAAFAELMVCWMLWFWVFAVQHKRRALEKPVVTDPGAKWGILLQALGYALAWIHPGPIEPFKPAPLLIASMILGPLSTALGWRALRHLGKQWRIQAALSEDHKLVQTGPYRWIRHPIYASMLGMLLATGFVWTWSPMFAAAVCLYLTGTEIRIRSEDRLLAARFPEAFAAYRSRVRAYIPYLR